MIHNINGISYEATAQKQERSTSDQSARKEPVAIQLIEGEFGLLCLDAEEAYGTGGGDQIHDPATHSLARIAGYNGTSLHVLFILLIL